MNMLQGSHRALFVLSLGWLGTALQAGGAGKCVQAVVSYDIKTAGHMEP